MESAHTAKDEPDAPRLLEDGPVYRFHDWPNLLLPDVAAGVYIIWREEVLIYAGMAGRQVNSSSMLWSGCTCTSI